jgi:ATP-dependent Lon protease
MSDKNKTNKKRIAPLNLKKSSSKSDSETEWEDEEETTEKSPKKFDKKKYRKFLSKMFPSKYMSEKVKEDEESGSDNSEDEEEQVVAGSEEEEEDSSSDYGTEEGDFIDKKRNYGIILTIGGPRVRENIDDEETENEDDPVSSDEENKTPKKKNSSNKKQRTKSPTKSIDSTQNSSETELTEVLDKLSGLKDNSIAKVCLDYCNKNLEEIKAKQEAKTKKQRERNTRIFTKIIREKNNNNDTNYFNTLDIQNQIKIIKELKEVNKLIRVDKPYRLMLLESDMPIQYKAIAIKKINTLRNMEPHNSEFHKMKSWLDLFMKIPFGKYETLPVSIESGVNKCHDFIENSLKTLDTAVYGLNDAKMQIMQLIGQLLMNPTSLGNAIAIHGPMGTGKTSLVKEGISKILNRPFAFIGLGGATDSSHLEGHSYTYEGSTCGKIVQILIDSKCMNPVIYFDELDKISETPKGEEIVGLLTHLTDTTQNTLFHDKYFSDIDFDLSKCLFIFSYNDESKINPILKDRMYRIQTKGYNMKQKVTISSNYLLPRIREQVKFEEKDIIIPEQTIQYIIENYCDKEDGVRTLKRCLEIIHTKLNLYRLMNPGTNIFEQDMSLKVEFPFNVTKDVVDKLIKKEKDQYSVLHTLYI